MDENENQEVEQIQPPGEPAITLTEDDAAPAKESEEEERPQQAGPRDPKTGKWTAQKRERFVGGKKAQQELQRIEAEKSALQQRLDDMERGHRTQQEFFATILQRLPGVQQAREPAPTADDHALNSVEARMETELAALAADRNRPQAEYRKMERERARIIARMEFAALNRNQTRQEQAPTGGVPPQYAYRNEIMKSEFPWLEHDQGATSAAMAYRNYLLRSGYPDTIETDRTACAHVASDRKIPPGPRQPSQRDRQAMAGIPGNGARLPRQAAPRAVSIPAAVLKGTGLSKQALAAALLSDDE